MSQDSPKGYSMTREAVLSGEIRKLIVAADPAAKVLSDEEHSAGVAAMLASRPDSGDVWVFAYGSLLWNPMIHFTEKRVATVHGFHRRFCLWTHLGRGSASAPGLILGLDYGGACRGLVYRIAKAEARQELELLWKREMVTGSYAPRWVRIVTHEGGRGWAVAFVINHAHPRRGAHRRIHRPRQGTARSLRLLFVRHRRATGNARYPRSKAVPVARSCRSSH
jgi:cation transport protein ChaC